MATSKKFSELPAASSVGNGDLFAIAHEDAQAETGYVSQKLTVAQAGQKVNGDTEYPTSLPSFPENGQNPFAALEKLNQDIIDLYPVNTASGSIANFTTSLIKPLVGLSSTIVAQQASGTPTPSSPLPISDFSSVSLTHTGKNLVNVANVTIPDSSSTTVIWEGRLKGTFSISFDKTKIASVVYPTLTFLRVYVDGAFVDFAYNNDNIIVTGTIEKIGVYGSQAYARVVGALYLQVEEGSTATAYEAYSADTHTIALPETIYGGSVDCINGTGNKDRIKVTLGSGTSVTVANASYIKSDACDAFITDVRIYPVKWATTQLDYVCNRLTQVKNTIWNLTGYPNTFAVSNNQIHINIANDLLGITDYTQETTVTVKAKIEAWLANNPVEIVVGIEPTAITGLTPANFTTFAGEQNIFADCGDISVSFKQGIQEYIDAKIAETQALIL